MSTFLLCVGIIFASGLIRLALVLRLSRREWVCLEDSTEFEVTSKVNYAISIASLLGVTYLWVIFYRDIVAAGLPVAG